MKVIVRSFPFNLSSVRASIYHFISLVSHYCLFDMSVPLYLVMTTLHRFSTARKNKSSSHRKEEREREARVPRSLFDRPNQTGSSLRRSGGAAVDHHLKVSSRDEIVMKQMPKYYVQNYDIRVRKHLDC